MEVRFLIRMRKMLKSTMVTVAQLCKHIKNHLSVYFKMEICTIWELPLNKAFVFGFWCFFFFF